MHASQSSSKLTGLSRPLALTGSIRRVVSSPALFHDSAQVTHDLAVAASFSSDIHSALHCEIAYQLAADDDGPSVRSLAACVATPPDLSPSSREIRTHVEDVIQQSSTTRACRRCDEEEREER